MSMEFNTVRSTLNDPQCVAEHRYQPADFIRKRSPTFERVDLSLLSGPIAPLRNDADALCQGPRAESQGRDQEGPVEILSEVSLRGPD